jgi:hypothetical protein
MIRCCIPSPGRRRPGFRETRQAKPNSPSRYRQQQTFGFRAHDGTRGSTREQRAPQQELLLEAVSDCQQHAVRSFPEHRRRDPKGLASAHVAPVCHMHYDAACPQWNGSIAVASRCTSKTTRLHTFTSSRQVTNVSVVIESLEVLAGTADSRDVTEALTWAKTNRDTLRRLWREYSE